MSRVTSTQIRPEADRYPMVLEVTPRYSDLDPSRRVGREALIRWFEDARVTTEHRAFPERTFGNRPAGTGQLLASIGVDVLAPLRIADDYRVGMALNRVGGSSFSYSYGVFTGDELVATGDSTSVWVEGGRPAPLPQEMRAALESLALPAATPTERREFDDSRLVRENYPFRYDVRTRFGDLDTNRHVNNVALAGWYLDGLAELHTDVLGYPVGGPLDGLSPSVLRVDYRNQVQYPGIYQLRVGVVELDDTEVRYACGLFDGHRCIGLADAAGAVRASDAEGRDVDLRAAFEPFRMRG
ncbi:thioesterase [Pseudonocardia sp. RS11V-5]|uniref:thioesterase family protein n=1 Tax=Pseudonocardia terrae TaxID=2905831 RepID=UPI001E3EB224|nr:thioesterase family protein [Pseudonocardia terrae]MCE3556138.1 thioesterase [Pseudonocardia terrae]